MPRASTAPAIVPQPHIIAPNAIYAVDEARTLLRLRASSIRREVREGRLRIAKRCGRYYLIGEWILEWLHAGEYIRAKSNNPLAVNQQKEYQS